jgi:DNA-binding transcriptional MerR regulator
VTRGGERGGWEDAALIPEAVLEKLEREHPQGLTSQEILDVFAAAGIKFSEATLRKYVQVGLLPRSIRVGRKGKHQGSQGLYPARVVRQISIIKEMMAADFTIEEIQREFLFVRGDIEELERTLGKIFDTLRGSLRERRGEPTARAVMGDVAAAETLATELVSRIERIEERLTTRAKLSKRAAG